MLRRGWLYFIPVWIFLTAASFARVSVAIVDFQGRENPAVATLQDQLVTAFSQSKRFSLVERSQLEKVLQEVGLTLSGLVAQQNVEAGQIKEVGYLLFGSGRGEGGRVALSLRMVNTETAEVVLATTFQNADAQALQSFLREAELLFPLEGVVVSTEGERAYIDLGSEDGVKPGMAFELVSQGEAVKDPQGKMLGYKKQKLGGGRVEEVDKHYAILKLQQTGIPTGTLALESPERKLLTAVERAKVEPGEVKEGELLPLHFRRREQGQSLFLGKPEATEAAPNPSTHLDRFPRVFVAKGVAPLERHGNRGKEQALLSALEHLGQHIGRAFHGNPDFQHAFTRMFKHPKKFLFFLARIAHKKWLPRNRGVEVLVSVTTPELLQALEKISRER